MYNQDKNENVTVICNKCGKKIAKNLDLIREGVCTVEIDWGYFSEKDGENHQFCLCEKCYDELVKGFSVPVRIRTRTELL